MFYMHDIYIYMVFFDFLSILCKERMSYYGIFGCSRKNADISEKMLGQQILWLKIIFK